MNAEIASAFAQRLRAVADHAAVLKLSVANLSRLPIAECRGLADWIDGAIAAHLAQAGGAVKIKPLEWEDRNPYASYAETPFGTLTVYGDGAWLGPQSAGHASSVIEAKKTVQDHYEARIRSALVDPPCEATPVVAHETADASDNSDVAGLVEDQAIEHDRGGESVVFAETESPEDRYVRDAELACPHCGGSGHKDDVAAALEAQAVRIAEMSGSVAPQPAMGGDASTAKAALHHVLGYLGETRLTVAEIRSIVMHHPTVKAALAGRPVEADAPTCPLTLRVGISADDRARAQWYLATWLYAFSSLFDFDNAAIADAEAIAKELIVDAPAAATGGGDE
ncbi:hypothetical protein [Ancylobacter amanitiformis]|uniref:Uncharacterized protein n=1 Tax=Ancylobacter amanitiformis TaxID=217069 RepID=A0ABU0LQG7_9HYPH|nr:hypothetical protein [Ancylobacter amanitiformis]MDQ0510952.1 hypothetical protein [Ancylobacter amanitiformis]